MAEDWKTKWPKDNCFAKVLKLEQNVEESDVGHLTIRIDYPIREGLPSAEALGNEVSRAVKLIKG